MNDFTELLSETRNACLENYDLAVMYVSFYRGKNRLCDLSRFCNFDQDNAAIFINMLQLRKFPDWSDERMYELEDELIKKFEL